MKQLKLIGILLIAISLPLAMSTGAWAKKGGDGTNTGKGGGKGGLGELGSGCLNLPHTEGFGTLFNDGFSVYCHGEDGQISVPKRFRMDNKKFNGNDSIYWVKAICSEPNPDPWCGQKKPLKIFQSQMRYNQDGELYNPDKVPLEDFDGIELHFQEMKLSDAAVRVSFAIRADGERRSLLFGNKTGTRVRCDNSETDGATGPVWVKCTADDIPVVGDNLCDRWTISTTNLVGDSVPNARACLKGGTQGILLDSNVTADFTLDVCVLGANDIAPCPDLVWLP